MAILNKKVDRTEKKQGNTPASSTLYQNSMLQANLEKQRQAAIEMALIEAERVKRGLSPKPAGQHDIITDPVGFNRAKGLDGNLVENYKNTDPEAGIRAIGKAQYDVYQNIKKNRAAEIAEHNQNDPQYGVAKIQNKQWNENQYIPGTLNELLDNVDKLEKEYDSTSRTLQKLKFEDTENKDQEQISALENKAKDLYSNLERMYGVMHDDYGYRYANAKDLTINSLKQGYLNSRAGEESFNKGVMGDGSDYENRYEDALTGEDYRFIPKDAFQQMLNGGLSLTGQQLYQATNPRTALSVLGGGLAGLAAAGPAGMAKGATLGFSASSAVSNMEIEAGFAYDEMRKAGVPHDVASKVSMVVGGVNGLLESMQLDELIESLKVLEAAPGSKSVLNTFKEIVKRNLPGYINEIAQEDAQELTTILGVDVAGLISGKGLIISPGEAARRIGENTISSALSFGLNYGGTSAISLARTVDYMNRTGKKINYKPEDYKQFADIDIEAVAKNGTVNPDVKASAEAVKELAQDISDKLDAGDKVSDFEKGSFENAVNTYVDTLKSKGYMEETAGENAGVDQAVNTEPEVTPVEEKKETKKEDDVSLIKDRSAQFPEDAAKVYVDSYDGSDIVSYDENMKKAYFESVKGNSLKTLVDNDEQFKRFYSEHQAAVDGIVKEGLSVYQSKLQEENTASGMLGVKAENKDITEQKSSPQVYIANEVLKYVEKGQDFSANLLYEIANKAYGGTMAEGAYTVKDAYDGMELAVNKYLMNSDLVKNANGGVEVAKRTIAKLQDILAHIPTQTKRTDEQQSFQQFSTPPNIAYIASWVANVTGDDVVLEPSAGIGGLALFPKALGATVYGNELSERRLAFLNELGLDGTFNLNAEQIDNMLPDEIKPTLVIMNPPFSATAGRTSKNNTANAKRHIEQALDRLQPGGRLVAILGNGMADDAPSFKSWWNELRQENNIRANIRIDGKNYTKYGTSFDIQLVVIDKTSPDGTSTITGEYTDLSVIPGVLEEVRNGRNIEAVGNVDERTVSEQPVSGRLVESETKRSASKTIVNDGKRSNTVSSEERSGRERAGSVQRTDESLGEREGTGSVNSVGKDRADNRPVDGLKLTKPEKETTTETDVNTESVFSAYKPKKVHIAGSKPHPAKLVESAAMASVDPPDATYEPHLPASLIKSGIPSDAQLENIVYAGQAHEQMNPDGTRKGFFIGDGTGVGKGVQIASIILDNFNQGRRKAVWISDKTSLVNDAKRDWSAVGMNEEDIISFDKLKKDQEITSDSGILFGAYSTFASRKETVIGNLTKWLGKDFDGVIAFDEAHNMGNAVAQNKGRGKSKPSQKALIGIEIQKAFPNARVIYVTATGATEPSNYAYLERLGLWGKGTAFANFNDFMAKITDGGLAAMELVARDMKAMGLYMARSISYDDVSYDTIEHKLSPAQTEIYNTMSRAWQTVYQNIEKALEITGASKNGNAKGAAHSALFGAQQRFYNQVLTSMSMPSVIADIQKELSKGKSIVIQLVNTNEAAQNRAIAKNREEGGDLDELDLTPSDMLIEMVKNSFPVNEYEEVEDENGNITSKLLTDANGNPVLNKKAVRMRDDLIADLKSMRVPDGPLEMLIDTFGTDMVAEVTGRSRRVVNKVQPDGTTKKVIETRTTSSGVSDANDFQDGKKRILVFSDAGGTGRSFHADKRAKNQQQRVHYVLQPGWNASRTVQGFGRTHRSNQASAPIFKLVTTDIMGQKRFTSTIAKRLGQLGALTKGQRDAGNGILGEKDNLENPIAMDTLSRYYRTVDPDVLRKLGLYDSVYDRTGLFKEGDQELRNIGKFLNRILSLEVDEQNDVFNGFFEAYETALQRAVNSGSVDMGLENYKADKVELIDEKVIRKDPSGADTKYVQMKVYNKPVIRAFGKLKSLHNNFMGLYRLEDGSVRAVYEISSKTDPATGDVVRQFKLEKPELGKFSTYVEKTFNEKATAIPENEWEESWKEEITKAPEYNENTLHLLTGALLPVWDRLPSNNTRVMRVLTTTGDSYLGRVIKPDVIDYVLRNLGAERTKETYTGKQIVNAVLKDGKKAQLSGRVNIERRRVSGEWRIELSGANAFSVAWNYPNLIKETINYERRYFIPTSEAGERIIDDIIKNHPVVSLSTAQETYDYKAPTVSNPDNWTAIRTAGNEAETKSIDHIIAEASKDFGIHIGYGNIRGSKKLGQYNTRDKGIRTKVANGLPTVAHELGHAFSDRYGFEFTKAIEDELHEALGALKASYPAKKWNEEGFAEFIRQTAANRDEAAKKYPKLTKMLFESLTGEDRINFENFCDNVNAYLSDSEVTAVYNLAYREETASDLRTKKEKAEDFSNRVKQDWVDRLHGIKMFSKEYGGRAYLYGTNAAYADAIAAEIIDHDLCGMSGEYAGPGLISVLKGISRENETEYKAFNEYLVCKHGPEYLEQGNRVFPDDKQNTKEWMDKRAETLEEEYPHFVEISKRLYEFVNTFMDIYGVKAGLISEKTMKELREKYPMYVPFNRLIEKTSHGIKKTGNEQNTVVKTAKGSGLKIIMPVENIMDLVINGVNLGLQNRVKNEIRNVAMNEGVTADIMEKIPAPLVAQTVSTEALKGNISDAAFEAGFTADDFNTLEGILEKSDDTITKFVEGKATGNIITILVNGKREFWKINNPLLFESLTNISAGKVEGITRVCGAITRFMTGNITGNNPVWSIGSNAFRDLMTMVVYNKNKKEIGNILKGIPLTYINSFRERHGKSIDPIYAEYMRMGGRNASAYSSDVDLAKRRREQFTLTKSEKLKRRLTPKGMAETVVDAIEIFTDAVERGPRFAIYRNLRSMGMDAEEAFYEAMDITVNFRKSGSKGKTVAKFVPFFNAGMQGTDKMIRYFTGDDAKKEDRAKVVKERVIWFVAASAITAAAQFAVTRKRKKEYEQLSSYTKNSFWCIPLGDGKFLTIPKPRELASLSSFLTDVMEMTIAGDNHALDEFYNYFVENATPAILSDLLLMPANIAQQGTTEGLLTTASGLMGNMFFGPVFYAAANRDFLGKPIVSQAMKDSGDAEALQYNERTSKLAYLLGKVDPSISPMVVDYLGNNILGFWWKVQKALLPVDSKERDFTLGLASTYVRDSEYSTDLVNWMYDRKTKNSKKESVSNNINDSITARLDNDMVSFYGKFNKLNNANTNQDEKRSARQDMLDIIYEYRKYVENGGGSKALSVLKDLCKETNTANYLPRVMASEFTRDGKKIVLTDKQYLEYQSKYNALLYEYIEDTYDTNASLSDRISVVNTALDHAKEKATNHIASMYNLFDTEDKYSSVTNKNAIHYRAEKEKASEDGSFTQDEALMILSDMVANGTTYEEALELWHSSNKSWKDKKFEATFGTRYLPGISLPDIRGRRGREKFIGEGSSRVDRRPTALNEDRERNFLTDSRFAPADEVYQEALKLVGSGLSRQEKINRMVDAIEDNVTVMDISDMFDLTEASLNNPVKYPTEIVEAYFMKMTYDNKRGYIEENGTDKMRREIALLSDSGLDDYIMEHWDEIKNL